MTNFTTYRIQNNERTSLNRFLFSKNICCCDSCRKETSSLTPNIIRNRSQLSQTSLNIAQFTTFVIEKNLEFLECIVSYETRYQLLAQPNDQFLVPRNCATI